MDLKTEFEKIEGLADEVVSGLEQSVEHFLAGVRKVPEDELRKAFIWMKSERAALQDEVTGLKAEVDCLKAWGEQVKKNWTGLAKSRLDRLAEEPRTIYGRIRKVFHGLFGKGA